MNQDEILTICSTKDDELPNFENTWWLARSELKQSVPNNAVERLKWMLKNSMGSPRAFEYRKSELMERYPNKGWYYFVSLLYI